jgi:hypothetical protein
MTGEGNAYAARIPLGISLFTFKGSSIEQFVVFEQDDHLCHSSAEQGCVKTGQSGPSDEIAENDMRSHFQTRSVSHLRLLSLTMDLSSSSRLRPQRTAYDFSEQEANLLEADQRRLALPLSPLRRSDSLSICPSPQRSPSYRALVNKGKTLSKAPLDSDDDRTLAETITSNASDLSSSPCQTSPTQRFKVYFESSFHSLQILEDITDGSMADDDSLSDGENEDLAVSRRVRTGVPSEGQIHSRRLLPTLSMQQRSIRRSRPVNGGVDIPKVASVRERMKAFESR